MSTSKRKINVSVGMVMLVLVMAASAFLLIPKKVEAKKASWKKKYESFLKKHSLDFSEVAYAKIDKNNTPELVTRDGGIYTIKNGKVKKVKNTKEHPHYYWEKGNCLYAQDGDAEGGLVTWFYTIKNGKLQKFKDFDYSGEKALANGRYWKINGEKVTEDEYKKELNSILKKYKSNYGKKKSFKYKDYTRYHYYDKGTRRYETNTDSAKVRIKGNKVIVEGKMESSVNYDSNPIDGNKHIFKLTSKTRYIGGDMKVTKKDFKKTVKYNKDLWIIIDTKNGKVYDIIFVG